MARSAAVARSAVEGSAAASNLIARLHQTWPWPKSCPSPPGLSVFLVPEHVISITRPREIVSVIPPDRTVLQRHDRRGRIELGTAWSFDSRGRTKVGWIGAVNLGSHGDKSSCMDVPESKIVFPAPLSVSYPVGFVLTNWTAHPLLMRLYTRWIQLSGCVPGCNSSQGLMDWNK